ncbi:MULTISPECIES: DUF2283 domain-containing protein [Cyanophyceae]|uniref:DUF2283 domain-containing protein n=1 Tax=Cyanophyceae TaxID=3028117 RepID=UPI00016DC844|nr:MULTISPECIES: DUF2283 domain-containing protein [Cyanophyceae]ACA98834.1 conserved hypothetical protein [Picosynechococcus sp. PCC 7002]SMH38209.1 Uncharacterized protein YuzE [Picosynechococcus sp. OG1]SMQ77962.1 Uncharacterized protein YuzE [Synechococcus sp. 7002]
MKIQYFQDTDTLYLEFNQNPIVETKDINENTLVDLDQDGKVCAITIEHAQNLTNLNTFSFETIAPDIILAS